MTDPGEKHAAKPAFSRPPTRPPARHLDPPDAPSNTIYLVDPIIVKHLASALGIKVFQVVADLMELKVFKSPDDAVDFKTASMIAQKHGYRAERPPPGMLVL